MARLAEAIRRALINGRLPCSWAFAIAEEHGLSPRAIGDEATRQSIKISRCQLGLFGYDDLGERRIVKPAAEVSGALKEVISSRLVEGKVPCRVAWEIASERKLKKIEVASAIETLGLRISDCQLGCFK
ncbi:hypothetical protein KAT59_08905 [Candidatus Bipolaricaulota bacterium]|nr:hypothetical protein [Candidatus Bipolaricaulota bacterium]